MAASSLRTYTAGQNRYARFCDRYSISPYPTSKEKLSQFVAFLFVKGLSDGTVKVYLSAVRHAQIGLGLGDPKIPDMPRLEYVVKGFRRRFSSKSRGRPRLPITPAILQALKVVWSSDADQFTASMLWAASCLCFFGFLRSGEVVVPSDSSVDAAAHLCFGDIAIDSRTEPSAMTVHLKSSKTDPFRNRVSLLIGTGNAEICPVAAVLSYMVQRGPAPGPLFRFSDGCYLTRARFVAALRSALSRTGIDEKLYSGHSFRIGAATTAARGGIQDSLIKVLGRWQSAVYQIYIRTPPEVLRGVARQLL